MNNLFKLFLLIFIFSGCVNHSHIPRHYRFLKFEQINKAEIKTEKVYIKKEKFIEVQDSNRHYQTTNVNPVFLIDTVSGNDLVLKKNELKNKFNNNVLNPKTLVFTSAQSNILKKSDLTKIKSIKKDSYKNHLPFWEYITLAALLVIGLIVNNYLIETIKQRTHLDKIGTPDNKPEKWVGIASGLSLFFSIIGILLLSLAILSFLTSTGLITYLAILFGALAAGISAAISLLLSCFALYRTRKAIQENEKTISRATLAMGISIFILLIILLICRLLGLPFFI